MLNRTVISLAAILCTMSSSPAQEGTASTFPFATFDAASQAVLSDPHDLVIGPDDRLYVANKFANRIAILDRDTLEIIGSFGEGELSSPHDIDFDTSGRAIVADTGNHRIAIYDFSSGVPQLTGSLIGIGRPEGALAHPNGRIYATSSGFGSITAFENGTSVATAHGLSVAHDIAVDSNGDLWVSSFHRSWANFTLKHVSLEDAAKFLPRLEGMHYPITATWLVVDILLFAFSQHEQSAHRTGIRPARPTQGYLDVPCISSSFFVIGRNCAVNKRRIRPLETFTASASNIVKTKNWLGSGLV